MSGYLAAIAVLVALSLLVTVSGTSLIGDSTGVAPYHSHVFLTDEAAINHSHSADDQAVYESEVVSLGSQSTDSAPGSLHLVAADLTIAAVSLTTTFQVPAADPGYLSPLSPTPEQPPQSA